MKLSSTTTSEKDSRVVVSDDYLKIDIKLGNRLTAFATVDKEVISFTFVGGGSYHERISKKDKKCVYGTDGVTCVVHNKQHFKIKSKKKKGDVIMHDVMNCECADCVQNK